MQVNAQQRPDFGHKISRTSVVTSHTVQDQSLVCSFNFGLTDAALNVR